MGYFGQAWDDMIALYEEELYEKGYRTITFVIDFTNGKGTPIRGTWNLNKKTDVVE